MGLHWNKRLGWGLETATADMARKTFCTMGERYFKFPLRAMNCVIVFHRVNYARFRIDSEKSIVQLTLKTQLQVTHHKTEKQFRTYVLEAPWEDLEQDCHIGRTITV